MIAKRSEGRIHSARSDTNLQKANCIKIYIQRSEYVSGDTF